MATPRIEIDLRKIRENTRALVTFFSAKGISLMGITKVVLGSSAVATAMIDAGVRFIGDSRIENIIKMKDAGIRADFVLIRTPLLSQAEKVVQYADISMNTELEVMRRLSEFAEKRNVRHKVILMVELGDLREGISPENLPVIVSMVLQLPGIELAGIGTNMGCLVGAIPEKENMSMLSDIARFIERRFGISLGIVSGGNSSAYKWFCQQTNTGAINNLRIGEMIFLGWDILAYGAVDWLHADAVTLVAEVIESNRKESAPSGKLKGNPFEKISILVNRDRINRAILAIGSQDVKADGLRPVQDVEIIGSSSDHLVIDTKKMRYRVGEEIRFRLTYSAMLRAMTSPYVIKEYLDAIELSQINQDL